MATPLPAKVTITRTPLAGGASETITHDYAASTPAWVGTFDIVRTLSTDDGEVTLTLDNEGRRYGTWAIGDFVTVAVQGPLDESSDATFSGFVSHIEEEVGIRNRLIATVTDLKALLATVTISTDEIYTAQAYTTIVADLLTTYLPGVTQSITTDAATTSATFQTGTTLRAALDHLRHGLNASTSSKWEYRYHRDEGTPTLEWYIRAESSPTPLSAKDFVAPLVRDHGSLFDVVNQAYVEGATHTATAADAASQTKYANLIPGGVLAANRRDDFLKTQEMVDDEAAALIEARSDVQDRIEIELPLRNEFREGGRVLLDSELQALAGLDTGEYNIFEVHHLIGPASTTRLILNERPRSVVDASKTVAGIASQQTL